VEQPRKPPRSDLLLDPAVDLCHGGRHAVEDDVVMVTPQAPKDKDQRRP
jgi:hypothetical protein